MLCRLLHHLRCQKTHFCRLQPYGLFCYIALQPYGPFCCIGLARTLCLVSIANEPSFAVLGRSLSRRSTSDYSHLISTSIISFQQVLYYFRYYHTITINSWGRSLSRRTTSDSRASLQLHTSGTDSQPNCCNGLCRCCIRRI